MRKPPSIGVTQLTSLGLTLQGKSDRSTATDLPLDVPMPVEGLYVHIPFCFHKCHYCDFYSIVDHRDRQESFVKRLIDELRTIGAQTRGPLRSIFVGGGTPTLLAPNLWQRLLHALDEFFSFSAEFEFSVEANPETVTVELLDVLVAGGVNRLSIGAQTFDERHLKTLERWHDPASVDRSVGLARASGIDNISLDLIFAIPGQTIKQWRADLDRVLSLQTDHLSCYGLMYEPNTPMTMRLRRGEFERVDDDLEAAMYELTIDRLIQADFEQYEISNWARPDRQCAHNLLYWHNRNWWACGPGAAAHVNGWRWKNVPRLESYIGGAGLPEIQDIEHLDDDSRVGETLLLRFRLLDGMPTAELDELLNATASGPLRRAAIDRNLDAGLLESRDGTIRLTNRGLMLADSVIAELL